MANFVVATGVQPSEYRALTILERNAIRSETNRQRKRK